MTQKPRVLISACLLGVNCRYNGTGKAMAGIADLLERAEVVPVCPEQLGGLPTPRSPSERSGGRVVMRDGADATEAFARGAEEVCALARLYGTRFALLKARSPSCGSGTIYDGTFSHTIIPGDGVAAEALRAMGVALFDEDHLPELLECL